MSSTVSEQPLSQFTDTQADVLTEIVNIGVGRAASSLSELIGTRIELTVPKLRLVPREEIAGFGQSEGEKQSFIFQEFKGSISGKAGLLFGHQSSLLLSSLLAGVDDISDELDIELSGILLEVGNIVLNAVMGTMSNMIHTQLDYTVPELIQSDQIQRRLLIDQPRQQVDMLMADVEFKVAAKNIQGSIMIVFHIGSVEQLVSDALKDC